MDTSDKKDLVDLLPIFAETKGILFCFALLKF